MTLIEKTRPVPTGDPRGPHRGDVFKHAATGARYVVLGIVRLEADGLPAVRYALATGNGVEWVRPVGDWFADNGHGRQRFELVGKMVLP